MSKYKIKAKKVNRIDFKTTKSQSRLISIVEFIRMNLSLKVMYQNAKIIQEQRLKIIDFKTTDNATTRLISFV